VTRIHMDDSSEDRARDPQERCFVVGGAKGCLAGSSGRTIASTFFGPST
jgi:hypothetical protein